MPSQTALFLGLRPRLGVVRNVEKAIFLTHTIPSPYKRFESPHDGDVRFAGHVQQVPARAQERVRLARKPVNLVEFWQAPLKRRDSEQKLEMAHHAVDR